MGNSGKLVPKENNLLYDSYSSLGLCSRLSLTGHVQRRVYLATEAATPGNGLAVRTVRGYGGPTVVILSAVDGPPGPSVAAVHGPGDHPWLPHLVQGD